MERFYPMTFAQWSYSPKEVRDFYLRSRLFYDTPAGSDAGCA